MACILNINTHNEQFDQIPESVKQLVIVRLAAMPSGYRISIGSQGSFTKDELIEHVKEGDEVEVKVIEVDKAGKIRLSRKVLLPMPEGMTARSGGGEHPGDRTPRPRGDRPHSGGRGHR
jgi:hypothetical protein